MLNSNDAASTSVCDSLQELRLVRAGEAKADVNGERESKQSKKEIVNKNVEVVEGV